MHEVAAGFGVRLDEAADAGCCGHPSRGAVDSHFASDGARLHGVPGLRRQPRRGGRRGRAALGRAHRARRPQLDLDLRAAAASFVPYVGCLADRDAALAALGDAAEQAGVTMEIDYPTLHNGCCGALGGMYRGATKASARLLEFAAEKQAPVVTTCVLCRDNLRSAARELKLDVPVHFWPEYFRAVEHAPEEPTDD